MVQNFIKVFLKYWDLFFIDGLILTLWLSAITVFFGVILGAFLALMKMSKIAPLRWISSIYIEIVRGTPMLLQLYVYYFLVPKAIPALATSKFVCIAIALALNSAAYVSEVIRSGIQSVDKGQTEAARSLGLSANQTLLRIVIPQAIRTILPAICNEFIMIVKDTSLASTFFLGDLMTQYKIVNGATFLVIEPLILTAIVYFLVTFTLSKVVGVIERRLKTYD